MVPQHEVRKQFEFIHCQSVVPQYQQVPIGQFLQKSQASPSIWQVQGGSVLRQDGQLGQPPIAKQTSQAFCCGLLSQSSSQSNQLQSLHTTGILFNVNSTATELICSAKKGGGVGAPGIVKGGAIMGIGLSMKSNPPNSLLLRNDALRRWWDESMESHSFKYA